MTNDIQATLKTRLAHLLETAEGMCDHYWDKLKIDNKTQDFKNKSQLFPRIGRNKNGFRIEWYHIKRWYKNFNGQWKKVTRYIPIGRGYRYSLHRYAKDWKLEALEDFENRAELIRREVEILDNAIKGYEILSKKSKELGCEVEISELQDSIVGPESGLELELELKLKLELELEHSKEK